MQVCSVVAGVATVVSGLVPCVKSQYVLDRTCMSRGVGIFGFNFESRTDEINRKKTNTMFCCKINFYLFPDNETF
jgi:hypothetical protein